MRLLQALLSATLAINANAAEGWQQLTPAGEFAARDGRPAPGKKWKLTDAQGAALAASFTQVAKATPIVVDYDHQTLYVAQHGQRALAAGWMSEGQWRPGEGFFAKVEWTAAAAQHIQAKEYRFLSPVLLYDEETFEVRGVALAALVNFPALLGMHPAVTALATQFTQEKLPMNPILIALLSGLGLAESATLEQATTALNALKQRPPVPVALATALKLQAGADEAAALAAITQLQAPDQASLTAMAALQTEVARLSTQLNGDKITSAVDAAIAGDQPKLVPAQRDWALNFGKQHGLAALSTYLEAAPVLTGLTGQTTRTTPNTLDKKAAAAALSSAESLQVAAAMGIAPDAWAKRAAEAAA